MIAICPICNCATAATVFRENQFPLRLFTSDPQPAKYGQLDIVRCETCGHLYNRAFSESLAEQMYGDVPLTNMPVHPSMMERLQQTVGWMDPVHYAGRRVVEIGGGAGHVARLLSQEAAEVIVFEPCRALTEGHFPEPNIRLVSDFYRGNVPESSADLIVCRQVIEHVADPFALLKTIRQGLTTDGHAYLEVPDGHFVDRNALVTDLVLQHVHYFTPENFIGLARRAGLECLRTLSIKDGHDIGMLFRAVPRQVNAPLLSPTTSPASDLSKRIATAVAKCRQRLRGLPGTVALYGATSQGQAILTMLGPDTPFTTVLDDNTSLQGWHLVGPEQSLPIATPTNEKLAAIDAIVIAAYLHEDAIAERLEIMGFHGLLLSARPEPRGSGKKIESLFADQA